MLLTFSIHPNVFLPSQNMPGRCAEGQGLNIKSRASCHPSTMLGNKNSLRSHSYNLLHILLVFMLFESETLNQKNKPLDNKTSLLQKQILTLLASERCKRKSISSSIPYDSAMSNIFKVIKMQIFNVLLTKSILGGWEKRKKWTRWESGRATEFPKNKHIKK